MNKNLYSGKLIAVDGPNGAGKTNDHRCIPDIIVR